VSKDVLLFVLWRARRPIPWQIDTLSIRRYEIKKVEYDYREMK